MAPVPAPPPRASRAMYDMRRPYITQNNDFFTSDLVTEGSAFKAVHVDGSVDYINRKALGGNIKKFPDNYFLRPQFIAVLVAQCLSNICAYLGWLVPSNTLELIATNLGAAHSILWAAVVWTLGVSIGCLLFGRLSDIFGRRWFLIILTITGILGCILAGAATNASMLITGSAFNGVAATGQFATNVTLGELVSNKHRGPILSIIYLASIPFAVFSPVVARSWGSSTVQGWRWSYYLGIILNGIALVLYYLFYYPPFFKQLHVSRSRVRQLKDLDWVGICLFITGWGSFLVGIGWGGATHPWKSAQVLCPLILGIVFITAFVVYEMAFCRVPQIMPPRLFKSIPFVALTVGSTVSAMVYCSITVLWPGIIQSLYTDDQVAIGWQSCVIGGGYILGVLLSCFAISYIPNVKLQVITVSGLVLIFVSALSSLSNQRWASTIAFGIISCTTIGYVENIALIGASLFYESQDIGLAVGALGSIKALGASVAQILYFNVWKTSLVTNIPKYVVPAAVDAGLPPDSADALLLNITTVSPVVVPSANAEVMSAAVAAFVRAIEESLRMVFYVSIPFSVCLLISAFFFPDFKPLLTDIVPRRLQSRQDRDVESQSKMENSLELE